MWIQLQWNIILPNGSSNTLKKVANNTCHTLHRYNCYKEYEKEKEMINMYRNMLEKGHLFYKSVPCAESILSGVYLNMRGFLQ